MTDEPIRPIEFPPQAPVVNGIPILCQNAPWSWSFTEIGTAPTEQGEEKLYLFRLFTGGMAEVIGPASYFRDMLDRMAFDLSGLQIARTLPPNNGEKA